MVVARRLPSSVLWAMMVVAGVTLVVAGTACESDEGADGTEPGASEDARRALLRSVSRKVLQPRLRAFATAAGALEDATAALSESPEDADARADAQAAFDAAMGAWQELEVLQVGPAGAGDMAMGGLYLRDEIYSWPTASPCRVDQHVVADAFGEDDFFSDAGVNGYGLDALEYLLFVDTDDNACALTLDINADGLWKPDEAAQGRARYAAAVAAELARQAVTLRDAWAAEAGDFAADFEAGAGPYGSRQEVLDGLFAAMFYLDQEVKDLKLAVPAGIATSCPDTTCPEDQESPFAERSLENVAENLVAVRALYHGGDPDDDDAYGFFDMLVELGAEELADDMATAIDDAVAAVDAVDGTLTAALEDNLSDVQGAHEAVKGVTDLMKSQFVTVLNLRVPSEGAGDND